LRSEELPVPHQRPILRVPEQVVVDACQGQRAPRRTACAARCLHRYLADEVLVAEDLVKYTSNSVDVLVADLHKDRASLRQEISGHGESIAEVREVGTNSTLPGVAEGLHHLGLT